MILEAINYVKEVYKDFETRRESQKQLSPEELFDAAQTQKRQESLYERLMVFATDRKIEPTTTSESLLYAAYQEALQYQKILTNSILILLDIKCLTAQTEYDEDEFTVILSCADVELSRKVFTQDEKGRVAFLEEILKVYKRLGDEPKKIENLEKQETVLWSNELTNWVRYGSVSSQDPNIVSFGRLI